MLGPFAPCHLDGAAVLARRAFSGGSSVLRGKRSSPEEAPRSTSGISQQRSRTWRGIAGSPPAFLSPVSPSASSSCKLTGPLAAASASFAAMPTAAGSLAQVTRTDDSGGATGSPSLAAWWRRRQETPVKTSNSDLMRLSEELEAHSADLLPKPQHVAQKDEFLKRLQQHLAGVIDGAEVSPFGSVVNGFWTPTSDVDICVRVPGASTRNAQIQVLRQISAELSQAKTHHVEPRFGAQVPILHWAPMKPGMVSCDISVNNVLAVVNSRLLSQYVRLDERLRTLGMCLKAWAQARGINDRSRGTFSSFTLVLMLIHFLQRREPPVMPSLQDIAFSQNHPPRFVNGVDCRYSSNQAEIQRELEYLRAGKPPNEESVGALLIDFFRYFGNEYRNGIIRIRDTRSLLPPGDESNCYLVVDNPFEAGKDVANIDSSQHDTIRKELRRAWSLLSQGRNFRELLRSPNDVPLEARARRKS